LKDEDELWKSIESVAIYAIERREDGQRNIRSVRADGTEEKVYRDG